MICMKIVAQMNLRSGLEGDIYLNYISCTDNATLSSYNRDHLVVVVVVCLPTDNYIHVCVCVCLWEGVCVCKRYVGCVCLAS